MSVLKYKGQDLMGVDRDWYDNLIPYPYSEGLTKTSYGVTFTVQSDGSIKANGTATGTSNSGYSIILANKHIKIFETGQTYTLSGTPSTGSYSTYRLSIYEFDNEGTQIAYYHDLGQGVTFTPNADTTHIALACWVISGQTVNNLVFKPMLERGRLKHPFKPPMDSSSNKVNKSDLLDLIYPVGSLYMSVNNTSPQTLFGGTWQQVKDRFLLSAGDTYTAGSTGGEATHTLTVNEMPSHTHTLNYKLGAWQWASLQGGFTGYRGDEVTYGENKIQATGGGQAHNNMPPYLAVYMWKRTA